MTEFVLWFLNCLFCGSDSSCGPLGLLPGAQGVGDNSQGVGDNSLKAQLVAANWSRPTGRGALVAANWSQSQTGRGQLVAWDNWSRPTGREIGKLIFRNHTQNFLFSNFYHLVLQKLKIRPTGRSHIESIHFQKSHSKFFNFSNYFLILSVHSNYWIQISKFIICNLKMRWSKIANNEKAILWVYW